jgi:thioredoxin reductase (NADPH)
MSDGNGSACDVLVVGGGLAGLTAGLFAARCGRSTVVLVPLAPGGTLLNIEQIEDFPGFPDGIAGFELGPVVQEQAEKHGAVVRMAELERLEQVDVEWNAVAGPDRYCARSVVIATGTRPRALGIEGEERLAGRGVSHCASCDGPLFRGAVVGVVGGGDSALQEALTLAEHAGRVLVFHRGDTLSAQETYAARVDAHAAIDVRLRSAVEAILGADTVSGVRVRDTASGRTEDVDLAGVFVYVGGKPEAGALGDLVQLDGLGRIVTDTKLNAGLPGLFAAGDVRSGSSGQAVAAAGDGAAAAMAAHRYLAELDRAGPRSARDPVGGRSEAPA